MDRSADVRAIDGRGVADRVVTDLARRIRQGDLVPGRVVRLRGLAERHGIRTHSLVMACTGLEREGLLTLRGDVAIVAPLDLGEVRSAYELLRRLEPDMITRASGLARPEQLERLRAMIPGDDDDRQTSSAVVINFLTELCRPAAAGWDLRIYDEIRRDLQRYLRLGFQVIEDGSAPGRSRRAEDADRNALCHDLLDRYLAQDVAGLRAAITEFRHRGQQVAELSFEAGHPSRRTLRLG